MDNKMRVAMPDGTRLATGAALVTNSVWLDMFSTGWQTLLSIGGGVVLALTIYKLVLEIQIRRLEKGAVLNQGKREVRVSRAPRRDQPADK